MALLGLGGVPLRTLKDSIVITLFYQGETIRTGTGALINTEHTPKRVAEFTVVFLTPSEEATVRANCPRGVPVDINWPQGDTTTALVEFGPETYVQTNARPGGYLFDTVAVYKRVPVRLVEV